MSAEMIFPAANTVGESLLWDEAQQRLLWVDIVGKTIHSYAPETGHHRSWETSDFVTSIGLRKDGGAVVAFTKSICLWNFDDQFHPLADIEPDKLDNRLNEGGVGPDGAFWVGTMQNNIAPDGSPVDITRHSGQWYRCEADGTVTRVCDDSFGITNTLAWTDDGHVVTADSLKNEIYMYRLEGTAGHFVDRRTILSGFERGVPDGSAMDTNGDIWNCRVAGGSCVVQFSTTGEMRGVHELPCSWPTSCAFGGRDMDTLYVTSARFTMSPEHITANPHEGGLFALRTGTRGRPSHKFG